MFLLPIGSQISPQSERGRNGRPKFVAQTRIARTPPENYEYIEPKISPQSGRARPLSRGIRGKTRGTIDRSQFV